MKLEVILLNDISLDLNLLMEALDIFSVKLASIRRKNIMEKAYNPIRKQYSAEKLLKDLYLEKKEDLLLALTDKDIYVEGLNFIFGLALPSFKSCIVSFSRLKSEDDRIFKERIFKEIVHELGHIFGLEHCENRRCIMYFANSIEDVDYRFKGLCEKCLKKLRYDFL
ncbi:hypothetical protein HRbin06_00913 [archaeon HR06]|nr:hypothetical protein HRbin06_00913 [archaeon HR06]